MRSPPSIRYGPLAVVLFACAPTIQSSGLQSVLIERLYFGRNVANTLGVTDSAWSVFVREVVGARLPKGFTYWAAQGEWQGTDGRPNREPSFVLEFVHPDHSAAVDSAVVAIIAEYKRRFNQQSVLRVITTGRASF